MVSYPWEWPFSLLKDVALIQLDAMEILLPHGFWQNFPLTEQDEIDNIDMAR
ncbi:MAG: hypothetical protein HQ568_00950 [Calditrichaeota bacterium]|nr:hypothetical protein [Calditrichota bacterium]